MPNQITHNGSKTTPRPHDLLWITGVEGLATDQLLPTWATAEWLAVAPVVIRRETVTDCAWLPVGLRGTTRSERFKALLSVDAIKHCVQPEFLVQTEAWNIHSQFGAFPAVKTLASMASSLTNMGLHWGPTGSVGFALATGLSVLRDESDLDIVLHAPSPISPEKMSLLQDILDSQMCRIDLQIDTGSGGFAFAEWAAGRKTILLKTGNGPVLTADPWSESHQLDTHRLP
ncbi:malonate decarboxylase holo-ACP synthase [Glaciimonas sp. Gout2]|uniref:malonate decarboxylase holo-ACP synthase n=1 Tax=unclassified Glaciimonas TaxID=2644401 RepID=UPI002B227342|nr:MULTISPECIES: malonate decarboxylase holo-ACP synthase [unclassified Glaciimonas]MEB0010158.1 malonate decarboxylase holo-ACP synthase [Glaciimonas sp. Cout2]MEB0084167.1 malonate decarboxylase holo-ACP synthase [Glaciimonas sp. Gout2]